MGLKIASVRVEFLTRWDLASAKMLVQVAAVVLTLVFVLLRTYHRTWRHNDTTDLTLIAEFRICVIYFHRNVVCEVFVRLRIICHSVIRFKCILNVYLN